MTDKDKKPQRPNVLLELIRNGIQNFTITDQEKHKFTWNPLTTSCTLVYVISMEFLSLRRRRSTRRNRCIRRLQLSRKMWKSILAVKEKKLTTHFEWENGWMKKHALHFTSRIFPSIHFTRRVSGNEQRLGSRLSCKTDVYVVTYRLPCLQIHVAGYSWTFPEGHWPPVFGYTQSETDFIYHFSKN